jgi:hypothetical protein
MNLCNLAKYKFLKLTKDDTEASKHVVMNTILILIYLLTAIGLPPGGSCTIQIYTQTIHRTTQNKQYIEQHKI